jgi:glutamine amidotransferase
MIAIINYGSGNVQAISNIFHRLGVVHEITDNENIIQNASKLILPGVGSFDEVMHQLNHSGLRNVLDNMILREKKEVLGVCVGMQIMAKSSEEGVLNGLGWIDGMVKKIEIDNLMHKPHLPHMGWNIAFPAKESNLLKGIQIDKGFYFLHSYCFHCVSDNDILMFTEYGHKIVAAVNHQNVYGTQFHPEKSHNNGILIFKNFAEI